MTETNSELHTPIENHKLIEEQIKTVSFGPAS